MCSVYNVISILFQILICGKVSTKKTQTQVWLRLQEGKALLTTTSVIEVVTSMQRAKGLGISRVKEATNQIPTAHTASITVTSDILTGQLTATICYTHYGHSIQLGHVPLPTSTRMEVAAKIMQGVSTDHILDTIRDNMGDKVVLV